MNAPVTVKRSFLDIDRARRTFRVHRDAYRNPEVFAQEMKTVFDRCWLYIGHESEIEQPGRFVRRRIAGRELILLRSRRDGPRAFYNTCTHRGVTICREQAGQTKVFTCPYHGWVFNTDGRLVDQGMAGGYGEDFNCDGRYDLLSVPRLDHYRGFYFINFNARAISLTDYLAGAREFIDLVCDQTEVGHTLIGKPHEYAIGANYKYLAENSYDGYHGIDTHRTYFEFLADRLRATGGDAAVNRMIADYPSMGTAAGLGMGHGYFETNLPNGKPVASWTPPWGPEAKVEIDRLRARIFGKHGEQRGKRICDHQKNLIIFPNLVINDHVSITVRVFQPESVDRMRVTAWAMGPKDESALLRKLRLDNFLTFLGPAGFATPDDNEMLELAQVGVEHTPLEWSDISRGMQSDDNLLTDGGHWTDEDQVRAYWFQWDSIMRDAQTLEVEP
jgi:p-cumate 2,3-dioxygenase subunit alpha